MSTEQYRSMIYRWVDAAWNNGNFSLTAELYDPSYCLHDISSPAPITGVEALKQFITTLRTAFPDLVMAVEQVIAEGELVAWRFRCVGTQSHEFMGIPASGRSINITGMVMTRFSDGKWAEDYTNWDLFGMLQQLGAIPAAAGS